MNQRRGPQWGQQWDPSNAGRPRLPRHVSFGSDDPRPVVAVLDGAYEPAPIPPDYRPPPGVNDPQGMARVMMEEPTDGYWTRAGMFGFRREFQGPVPAEDEVIALTENLHLPGPPRIWNVQWFRYSRALATEGSANYGNWDVRGRVTYGVGGAQNVIECDVMSGQQMAVVANSIKCELVMINPTAGLNIGDPPWRAYDPGELGFVAGAMFGLDGAAGQGLPVTYSTPVYEMSALGAGEVDIIVPDFARSVVLHASVPNPANLALTNLYFLTPGFVEKTVNAQSAYAQLIQEKGITLPGHTNQIRLSVGAAAATANAHFSLQFFMAL